MSALEQGRTPLLAAGQRTRSRLRRVGAVLLAAFIAQYTIIALLVGLSVAGTLRYFVTPQIITTFEALSNALKR